MKVYTTSRARADWFNLLKRVQAGEPAVITKLDDHTLFKVERVCEPRPDKNIMVGQMAKLDFRSSPPEEIKRILVEDYGRN